MKVGDSLGTCHECKKAKRQIQDARTGKMRTPYMRITKCKRRASFRTGPKIMWGSDYDVWIKCESCGYENKTEAMTMDVFSIPHRPRMK